MNSGHEVVQRGEVLVMGCESAQQFPNALDGVEVRAVRWQKIQPVRRGVRIGGVMVSGVVENEHRGETATAMARKQAQKGFKRARIENRTEHSDQLAGPKIDRPEKGQGFARGRVPHDGVFCFRRNPHAAAGAMLLEVALVQTPEIKPFIVQHPVEFFLYAACNSGSPCAITGRGLRSRNPNFRKMRWDWRTPNST